MFVKTYFMKCELPTTSLPRIEGIKNCQQCAFLSMLLINEVIMATSATQGTELD